MPGAETERMVGNTRETASSRNPMRRTTSLTDFAPPDVLTSVVEDEEEVQAPVTSQLPSDDSGGQDWLAALGGAGGAAKQEEWLAAYRGRAAPPVRAKLRRNSADCSATEAAAFLRACGLCRRRLGPGRDTFMYKGEAAFCSLECRQQHMTQEEWKDNKCTVTSRKDASAAVPAPAGRRRGSGKPPGTSGSTVAAV